MAKWLVTGAAGFIGSNIVKKLINDGQEVLGLDNLSNGDYSNIEEFRNSFEFYEGDIRNPAACEFLCNQVDYVLHQAALTSVPRSIKEPINVNDNNVTGFLNILYAAKEAGVKKFVYASSSSVYGDNEDLPKIEGLIGKQLSPYAATKRVNEIYASVFNNVYGIDTIGLRYFNVYGPNQKFSGPYATVIPIWCKALIKNEDAFIFGDGTTSRDFCYVEDVVQANILAAKSSLKGSYVFNVAVGDTTSLNDLFELIKNKLGKPDIKPIYKDFRPGDIKHSLASIINIEAYLGYDSQYKLNDGLNKAIEWYKKKLK
jgi:UDP-N-acetylglucosamine 4-epimerase